MTTHSRKSSKATSDEDREILASAGTASERTRGRFGSSYGMPAEQSEDFRGAVRRLGQMLVGERLRLAAVLLLTAASVVLVVIGPRLLGNATDVIVRGVLGPSGIDFTDLHHTLEIVAALYLASWAMSYLQAYILAGVIQRSMYALRESVEQKLNRLPLGYVDRQPAAIYSVESPTTSTTSLRVSSRRSA